MNKERKFFHVCEVSSHTSLKEWNLEARLEHFAESNGLSIKIAMDSATQKTLRFSLLQEDATSVAVSKLTTTIRSIVTDAKISWPGLSVINPDLTYSLPKNEKEVKIGAPGTCINAEPLPGNAIGPKLEQGKVYIVGGLTLDSKGNQHLDVGVASTVAYVQSFETKEELPEGKSIHWCHPSRFIFE